MGTRKHNRDRRPPQLRWGSLNQQEQGDTVQMGRRYLAGETLGELSKEFGYPKFKIAYMICWLHGIKGTQSPRFRHELRANHRAAKANRENAPRSL